MAARNKQKQNGKKGQKGLPLKKNQQPNDNTSKVAQENTSDATTTATTTTTTESITTPILQEKSTEMPVIEANNHESKSSIINDQEDHKDIFINIEPSITSTTNSSTVIVTTDDFTPVTTKEKLPEVITIDDDDDDGDDKKQQQEEHEKLLPKVAQTPLTLEHQPSTSTTIDMTNDISTALEKDIKDESIEISAQQLISELTKLNTASGTEVYLLGTAHFSHKSVEDVRKIIRHLQPNAVVLELCQERAFMLELDEESLLEQNRKLSFDKIRSAIREKGIAQGLIYIMFVKMSANLTEKLGMAPGSEFRAGSSEALKVPGCSIILGDRSLKVTIARAVASISLWQKIKLIYQVLLSDVSITQEDVEKCKDKDILEQLLKELGGEFPGFKQVLLDERNIYLAHSIYKWSQNPVLPSQHKGPAKVLAIVGCGHVNGIVENWGQTREEEVRKLMEIPKSSRTKRVVTKTIKYCSLALLLYVSYRVIMPSSLQAVIHDKIVG